MKLLELLINEAEGRGDNCEQKLDNLQPRRISDGGYDGPYLDSLT